jgi:hypothetical protein
MMRFSKYVVNPSFSQKSRHVAFVTRLPDHEWASSCAASDTSDRSPARTVGETNVNRGFSMPPNGNDGGITRMSYRPQRYGPYKASAASSIRSRSANSYAAASRTDGSAKMPVRALPPSRTRAATATGGRGVTSFAADGPSGRNAMSPTASAIRYGGTGWSSANSNARPPGTSMPSGVRCSALITALSSRGTTTRAR